MQLKILKKELNCIAFRIKYSIPLKLFSIVDNFSINLNHYVSYFKLHFNTSFKCKHIEKITIIRTLTLNNYVI